MAKIKTKFLFSAIASFLMLILLMYNYFFVYSEIKFLSSETESTIRSRIILNEKRKDFELAKSNLEKQGENIKILESVFFFENGFVDLLNSFEDAAKKAGIKLKTKGANLSSSGGLAEISFEISGKFDSVARFLVLLDNMRYSGLVNKFSLFKNDRESEFLTANIDYLLFGYKK